MITLKALSFDEVEIIKEFFKEVFTKEPWNDNWDDENQLHNYIKGLAGNENSLTLGLFDNDEMVGLSMGNIRYWYAGTEYYIDELCIKTDRQGEGLGTCFIKSIQDFLKQRNIHNIFLQTERTVPAYEFYRKNGFYELCDHVSFGKEF